MTLRVLVVDDAPTVRMYHSQQLGAAGFEVAEAVNGLDALEAAMQTNFDLFLIDVNMPKMDGYSCVAALRGSPIATAAPIVVISTENRKCDVDQAYAAGANLHLAKPVNAAWLVRVATLLTRPIEDGER